RGRRAAAAARRPPLGGGRRRARGHHALLQGEAAMKPLSGTSVLALGDMHRRPLCRLLASLGADIVHGDAQGGLVRTADFLVEDQGLERLAAQGLTRELLEQWNPALVHVSVTPFGSGTPRAHWRGGELVASAMGGTLRLTG